MALSKHSLLAVLLIVCGARHAASTEVEASHPQVCSVGGWEPIPCHKANTVCVLSGQGDPHTGKCQKFDAARVCNVSSTYYAVGSSFPKGDNCNDCTCQLGIDDRRATAVCTDRPGVRCLVDPCQDAKCPAHPDAQCRANYCVGCNTDWYVDGQKVDCEDAARKPTAAPAPCPPCAKRCSFIFKPVCCPDGKQYPNQCIADCSGQCRGCTAGPCPHHCICPEIFEPVCSANPTDKTVYGNSCLASCQGAQPPFTKAEGNPPTCDLQATVV